jgi:hypothetical protein
MLNLAAREQDAQRDSKIKRSTTLSQVSGCQIDRDAPSRPRVPSSTNRRADSLAGLTYSGIREADNPCGWNPGGNVDFDFNRYPFNANECGGGDGGWHA